MGILITFSKGQSQFKKQSGGSQKFEEKLEVQSFLELLFLRKGEAEEKKGEREIKSTCNCCSQLLLQEISIVKF